MVFAHDGFNYILRLDKGELLAKTLNAFVTEHKISGGWISGLGGLTWAELGFFDMTAQAYLWTRFEEPLELLSLTGNIAWTEGKPFLHLHATVSDASQYARGGHVKEAEVNGTAEIFIHMWDDERGFGRGPDKSTGLKLLEL